MSVFEEWIGEQPDWFDGADPAGLMDRVNKAEATFADVYQALEINEEMREKVALKMHLLVQFIEDLAIKVAAGEMTVFQAIAALDAYHERYN